jgi:glycosyltransferase involved in cell wall biosynthesis
VPCLVLLGAPGMGKSREAEGAVRTLRTQGEHSDLIAVGRRADPLQSLLGLLDGTHAQAWRDAGHPWHLFIDGIDEALGAAVGFAASLGTFLDALSGTGGDLANMRIRFLCRTVEWTQAFDSLIETHWRADEIAKLQIAPLTREDIVTAIDIVTGDARMAQNFLQRVSEIGAESLASRPVSLRLLADLQARFGALPNGQAEVYRQGLEVLVDEHDSERRRRIRRGALVASERLTVAARIAAANAFSGRPRIWTGLGPPPPGSEAIPLQEIAGGIEQSPPESFSVSEADLLETVRTSLFVRLEENLFGWAHQTFMEYLAARYLLDHQLTAEQILDFLAVADTEGVREIAPPWREIAAWTATLSSAVFARLLDQEPDVLLQSDVAGARPEDRARLVDAFFERLESGAITDLYRGLRPFLGRLKHPGLANQLRPVLADTKRGELSRSCAIYIAEAVELRELTPDLMAVALAPTTPNRLRHQAVSALADLAPSASLAPLARILDEDLANDTNDELRGALLSALWPDQLPFPRLLLALASEKKTNLIGNYHVFRRQLVFPDLAPDDAVAAIEWLDLKLSEPLDGQDDAGRELIGKLFWAVAEQAAHPEVQRRLAAFVLERFDTLMTAVSEVRREQDPRWPEAPKARRDFVLRLLGEAEDPRHVARLLPLTLPGLLQPDDLKAYLPLLADEAAPAQRELLIGLLITLCGEQELDALTPLFDLADAAPDLREALEQRFSIQLDSSTARWMRDASERERKIAEKATDRVAAVAQADARLQEALDAIAKGEPEAWWRLNLQLFVSNTGRYEGDLEFKSDLHETPGWLRLSAADRERVTDGALSFLTDARLTTQRWLGTNTQHRPAAAAFRAMRLLRDDRPEVFAALPADVWRVWSAAALGFFDNDFSSGAGAHEDIVRAAYASAPDRILRVLARTALGPKSQGLPQRMLDLVAWVYDERLGAFLDRVRSRPRFKMERPEGQLFAFLVRHGHGPAIDEMLTALEAAGDVELTEARQDEIAAAASERMASSTADDVWLRLHDLSRRSPNLARAIWGRYASRALFRRDRSAPFLAANTLSQAYIDLEALFPDRPESPEARWLTPDDYVQDFQRGILETLVERGTAEAVEGLRVISDAFPHQSWLRLRLQEARRVYRGANRPLRDPAAVIVDIAALTPSAYPVRDAITSARQAIALDAPTFDAPSTLVPEERPDIPLAAPRAPLRILAVATEWHSGNGGISTINRDLCIALAGLGHEVRCLVLDASADDAGAARALGVQLVRAPHVEGYARAERYLALQASDLDQFKPDLVIGHDHITGPAANFIAGRFGGAFVHVLHTVPQDSEVHKQRPGERTRESAEIYEKARAQIGLACRAKLVVGVGPKISLEAGARLPNGPPVHELLPGLDTSLLAYRPDPSRLRRFQCLMSARMGDAALKGAEHACDAIRRVALNRHGLERPKLILRGFTDGRFDEEFQRIGPFEDYKLFVERRPYTEDAAVVQDDLKTVSLVLMPSLSEGFGLSAFEAIAAGVPVVVSFESGLADYLLRSVAEGFLGEEVVEACLAETHGPGEIGEIWAQKVELARSDPIAAFQRAERMRTALASRLTWPSAARAFVEAAAGIISVRGS